MNDIAIFDLDLTLISVDTTNKWVSLMIEKGIIEDQKEYLKQKSIYDQQYKNGTLKIEDAYQLFLKPMIDIDLSILESEFNDFANLLNDYVYPDAKDRLNYHHKKGDEVLLISASIEEILRPIGLKLGFKEENIIGSKTIKNNNRFNGEIISPSSFSQGKCFYFEEWISRNNKIHNKSIFYSDSINDFPLLNKVDNPICINPDPLLKDQATKNKWKIENWEIKV
jgi:HAD superfamily hydrolase (TIGR01490 family)